MTSQSKNPLVVIGICTRQRNALLRRLLESIWAQPTPPRFDIQVIIVDNNDAPSVHDCLSELPSKFELTVLYEPAPGMVAARNRVLDAATAAGAEWFIGVDDDETVEADWLAQFMIGLEVLNAEIIVAARRIVYPTGANLLIERIEQMQEPAGAPSTVFSSANFAMHKSVFDPALGRGMRFNPALNEAGGVDFEIMMRAKHQYGIIPVNWPHAVTVEMFDGKRGTLGYSLKRRFFNQARRYQIARLHRINGVRGTRWGNTKRIIRLSIRFAVFGSGQLLRGAWYFLIRHDDAYQETGAGIRKIVRGFAFIPYVLGMSVVNYGARVNADRTIQSS